MWIGRYPVLLRDIDGKSVRLDLGDRQRHTSTQEQDSIPFPARILAATANKPANGQYAVDDSRRRLTICGKWSSLDVGLISVVFLVPQWHEIVTAREEAGQVNGWQSGSVDNLHIPKLSRLTLCHQSLRDDVRERVSRCRIWLSLFDHSQNEIFSIGPNSFPSWSKVPSRFIMVIAYFGIGRVRLPLRGSLVGGIGECLQRLDWSGERVFRQGRIVDRGRRC